MRRSKSSPTDAIRYTGFADKGVDVSKLYADKLKELGLNFDLNYEVAAATHDEIRRARGIILQSTLTSEQLAHYKMNETVHHKLQQDEIDHLCHLITLAATSCGVLFWTKDLSPNSPLLKAHTKILEAMRKYTHEIHDTGLYSKFHSPQVFYLLQFFLTPYFQDKMSTSDNLGDHFASSGEAHDFLDTISISKLQKMTKDGNTIVVLAAAASSGILEAGIFAHYMNTQLGIPTTIDPMLFSPRKKKVTEEILDPPTTFTAFLKKHLKRQARQPDSPTGISSTIFPHQKTIVIPFDDEVTYSGYSAGQTKKAAQTKYKNSIIMLSPKMRHSQ